MHHTAEEKEDYFSLIGGLFMKTFVKHFQRFVCLLCVIGLFGFSTPKTVEAAEIYPRYPLRWSDRNFLEYGEYSVELLWYNQNVTDTRLTSNIPYAMSGWRAVGHLSTYSTNASTTKKVTFMTPVFNFWYAELGEYDYQGTLGLTKLFRLPDGEEISTMDIAAGAANGEIRNAMIFFNPLEGKFKSYPDENIRNLIMHELGHALGFGHYTYSTSIMFKSNMPFDTLSSYDINCFHSKYNEP